jgi:hypothetical protein
MVSGAVMDEYFWELKLRDGTKIPIPPEFVGVVKRKMEAKEPITTSRSVIPFAQVDGFDKTAKKRTDNKLLEDVAVAFKEPLVRTREFADGTNDEAVSVKWVKKQVSQREWDTYYSKGSYKRLNSEAGIVIVAMLVPTHLVDTSRMEYCTSVELTELTK